MRKQALTSYTGITVLLATAIALRLDWQFLTELPLVHLYGFAAFIAVGVISEYLSIPLVVGKSQGSHSTIFLLQFACVLVLGPAATLVVTATTIAVSNAVFRRKPFRSTIFNVAQHSLAVGTAGIAFALLGGDPSPDTLHVKVLAFVMFGLVLVVTNLVAVSLYLVIREGLPWHNVLARMSGPWGSSVLYDLLVTPVGVLIAGSYTNFWIWGLVGSLFLIFFVRRSYLVNYQLQQANRDLLKALVKAIETRDPYTSGHSVRVASLASRVARSLNLSAASLDRIETAALLHDVGKIDVIYSDILKKPHSLSTEEMEIIKSHVDKGIELLTSLSSFHAEVISAVRHHHERYDGSGYPSGISGENIPLGARIIKVCDAIDAMLSDRPYRKALALPDVREQLLLFSEREFDPLLVSLVLREGLLEEHTMHVASEPEEPRLTHDDPMIAPARVMPG